MVKALFEQSRHSACRWLGLVVLVIAGAGCDAGEASAQREDIQIRMRYQIALRGQDYFLLLPGNRIIQGLPSGGLDTFDGAKTCAADPEHCGTYLLKDGQMTITWDGTRAPTVWKHTVDKDGQEQMSTGMWMKGIPFPAGHRLDGTYKWSASAGSGTSRAVSVTGQITLRADGTFTREATGSVRAAGGDTLGAVSNSELTGTYALNRYTMTLTPNSGPVTKHTFFVQGNVKDLPRPGIVVYDGGIAFRIE